MVCLRSYELNFLFALVCEAVVVCIVLMIMLLLQFAFLLVLVYLPRYGYEDVKIFGRLDLLIGVLFYLYAQN